MSHAVLPAWETHLQEVEEGESSQVLSGINQWKLSQAERDTQRQTDRERETLNGDSGLL